jgi:hypothetical protein
MNLLFIGNSYTHFNNLPSAIAALSGEDISKWRLGLYLRGGAGMRTHFCDNYGLTTGRGRYCPELVESRVGGLDRLIEEGGWDAAIMQGQSMDTVLTADEFLAYGKVLADRLRAGGVERILLYQTWARQRFPQMQAVIKTCYETLATTIGAEIMRVGEAWERALSKREDLILHTSDESHPNAYGSYLAACVAYKQLTGRTCIGCATKLPNVFKISWENEEDSDESESCYDIEPDVARFLQEIACEF